MAASFCIDLLELKEGKPLEFDWRIGKEFFEEKDNSEILASDVKVSLLVEKRHAGYMLEFDFVGSLEVACDRCLDPVKIPIDTTYDLMVRHGEEYDDSHDDLLVIPDRQTSLDVSGLIYDTLLLEIPLQRVHAEGGCNPEMLERLNGES